MGNDLKTSIINEEDDAEENYQSRKHLLVQNNDTTRNSGYLKLNEDSVNVELGPNNLDTYGSKEQILENSNE